MLRPVNKQMRDKKTYLKFTACIAQVDALESLGITGDPVWSMVNEKYLRAAQHEHIINLVEWLTFESEAMCVTSLPGVSVPQAECHQKTRKERQNIPSGFSHFPYGNMNKLILEKNVFFLAFVLS